jgi:hypothetical protein
MEYNYFTHPRFIAFRKRLGYRTRVPGVYRTFPKHFSLVNLPPVLKNALTALFPTYYIETDLSSAALTEETTNAAREKVFFLQGTTYRQPPAVPGWQLKVAERGTFIIDLRSPLAEIQGHLEHSLRKQLAKEETRSIIVKPAETMDEFRTYYTALRAFRDPLHFTTPSWDIFRTQWDMTHGGPDSNYEVFLARDAAGTLLAGMGIVINPDTKSFIEVAAMRTSEGQRGATMDALRWGIVAWAHHQGLAAYDLAGVDPHGVSGSKEEGIYRNKRKWGGAYQPTYHYSGFGPARRWYYPFVHFLA